MNTIIAENLAIGYYGRPIVSNISFRLGNGTYALLGANGSGKTTLLKTIAGLIKPVSGKILVNNIEPYNLKRREAAKLIGYTWQNPYYGFVEARVIDEIRFILRTTGVKGNWGIVEKLVDKELFERDPYTLSGGEAKKVSIASVLVADQPIWLLDEPFNDLDYEGVIALIDIIKEGYRRGKLIIISSHIVSLLDCLEPDKYLLITRDGKIKIDDWDKLNDEILADAGVLPRRMICGSSC